MPTFMIRNYYTNATLFGGQFDTMRLCVEAARKSGAYLGGAYLGGVDLRGAYLGGANLRGADLRGAYLRGADLDGAYLDGADLGGADLGGAKIRDGVTINALARRATRSDGYEFLLLDTSVGWRVLAGCRFFDIDGAWRHWEATRGGTALGDESLDILTMFSLHLDRVEGSAA